MTHMVLTADDNLDDDRLALLGPNREPVHCSVRDIAVATDLYDHVVMTTADLPPLSGANYDLTTGSWAFVAPINLGTNNLRVPAGETVYLNGFGWHNVITGTSNYALRVSGTLLAENIALAALTSAIQLQTGELYLRKVQLAPGGAGQGIRVSGGSVLDINGGRQTVGQVGIYLDGNCSSIRLAQFDVQVTTAGVQWISGTIVDCHVLGCKLAANVGITWNAANLPTSGLLVTNTHFQCVNNYAGHTPASANANYKANSKTSGGAGLLTETAIVP